MYIRISGKCWSEHCIMQIRYVLCDANRRGECMFMCVYSWHVHMCVCRYTCIYCIIVFLGTRALCARACMYIIHDMPATGLVSASYVFKASECYRGIYINCINNFMAGSFPPGWCCVDIYTYTSCLSQQYCTCCDTVCESSRIYIHRYTPIHTDTHTHVQ